MGFTSFFFIDKRHIKLIVIQSFYLYSVHNDTIILFIILVNHRIDKNNIRCKHLLLTYKE